MKLASKTIQVSTFKVKTSYNPMNSKIHKDYESILRDCIFVSKPKEWFIEGYQVELQAFYSQFSDINNKFNSISGSFYGITPNAFIDDVPAGCSLEEFEIYDKYGNEISQLTLLEYRSILRGIKIKTLLK